MLYHFSEDPSIKEFIPLKSQNKEMPPTVWAIDEEHAVHYFFPRDCPRVIYSKSANMSEEDEKLFFSHTLANKIIAVENAWMEKIKNTTLYKYTFHDEGFQVFDQTAGYYITHSPVQPISLEPMGDLLGKIAEKGVELRVTPNLYPLRDAIISSTIDDFSIIRFRNAEQPKT
ncbi:hypothetical protein JOC86_003845 [Bacillus pakistanensis]|uniref:Uncharacterized protein n=1 Tax=Rossellomorea pakistanensis TaxID=992288 RepID=A0ABS2NHD0_9BACI|nr:DUF6886 family protein [Bacillus pakistanensis]MBM7587272.1 hypothetical protein [Bacillus pakistanensis]